MPADEARDPALDRIPRSGGAGKSSGRTRARRPRWARPRWARQRPPRAPSGSRRASGMSGDEQRKVAAASHVRIYGDAVGRRSARAAGAARRVFAQRARAEPVRVAGVRGHRAEAIDRRAPRTRGSRGSGARTSGSLRRRRPASRVTLDQLRIAYNVAIASGDKAAAGRWRQRIEARARSRARRRPSRRGCASSASGSPAASSRAWRTGSSAAGPMSEASFNVRSTMEARESFSLIAPDPTDREMASPPSIPDQALAARVSLRHTCRPEPPDRSRALLGRLAIARRSRRPPPLRWQARNDARRHPVTGRRKAGPLPVQSRLIDGRR